uniref:Cupin type-1 domain-containing protein n=1 Tax=Kalanchoe fedtschenkoi TaxID=63787 RepID=A0A7N0UYF6_KALFE
MAVKLSSFLCLLALINVACAARQQQPFKYQTESHGECQIQRLQALEPTNQIRAEAGSTDIWNHNEEQLKCAGATVIRHTIEPQGLLLPSYSNAPQLVYVIQGKGIQGVLLPGCPDTYQSGQSEFEQFQHGGRQGREEHGGRGWSRGEEQEGRGRGQGSQRFQDRHQKIRHFRAGDILAIPAGVSYWAYNDGNEQLITVVLLDNTNFANQLDINPRRFYLAGSPQEEHQQRGRQQHGKQQGRWGSQGSDKNNVFSGFEIDWLSQVFNVDRNVIEKLQGQNDQRGNIVRVQGGLQVIQPPHMTEHEQGRRGESEWPRGQGERGHGGRRGRGDDDNGFEETLCNIRLRENIDDPERAAIYTPRGGRVSTINSFNLPVLSWLDLSAERGVLYQNGIIAPHYYSNAHSITYVTRGQARIQVVDDQGQTVFDDVIREGQLLVEPQNYVILKQALQDGYEYISFKTSDNAFRSTLAGRNSVFRGLPVGVIANAYQISPEEAELLKFNRDETTVFQGQRSSERIAVA